MHIDALVRKSGTYGVHRCLLGQMRMQRGPSRAIQIAEVIEFNKEVFFIWVGSRKRYPLPAHRIAVSLAVFPDIQQAVVVGVEEEIAGTFDAVVLVGWLDPGDGRLFDRAEPDAEQSRRDRL